MRQLSAYYSVTRISGAQQRTSSHVHRLSPADLRRAPIEPCRRPSSVETWIRYGRSIGIAAAIETPVSMIPRYPCARCTRRSAVLNSSKEEERNNLIGQIHGCLSVATFWNSSPPPARLLGEALALNLRTAPSRLRPDASSRQTGVAVLMSTAAAHRTFGARRLPPPSQHLRRASYTPYFYSLLKVSCAAIFPCLHLLRLWSRRPQLLWAGRAVVRSCSCRLLVVLLAGPWIIEVVQGQCIGEYCGCQNAFFWHFDIGLGNTSLPVESHIVVCRCHFVIIIETALESGELFV